MKQDNGAHNSTPLGFTTKSFLEMVSCIPDYIWLMKWALKGPHSNAAERSCSHKLLSCVNLQTELPVSFSTHASTMTHESPCFDNNTDFWAWTMTLWGPGRKLQPLQSQILLWRLLKRVMQPSQSRSGTIFKVNLSNQNTSSVSLN